METDRKGAAETEPLFLTGDFFRKVVIRMDISRNYHDENGIWHLGLTDFLLGKADLF